VSDPARSNAHPATPWLALLVAAAAFSLAACSSAPTVARRDVDEAIDISGYWNDTDSRLVSEEMIGDCLSSPWSNRASASLGRQPRVIVGTVRNKSQEHLSTQTFVKDLERSLVNSGVIDVVASRDERQEIREERADQQQHASLDTAKSMGRELAADYMLQGQINSVLDQAGKEQLRYYQVELELVDLESNRKVWIGQKKIKKTVTYRKNKFQQVDRPGHPCRRPALARRRCDSAPLWRSSRYSP
jgi:uncharacterized protein (TIGR02722 family)